MSVCRLRCSRLSVCVCVCCLGCTSASSRPYPLHFVPTCVCRPKTVAMAAPAAMKAVDKTSKRVNVSPRKQGAIIALSSSVTAESGASKDWLANANDPIIKGAGITTIRERLSLRGEGGQYSMDHESVPKLSALFAPACVETLSGGQGRNSGSYHQSFRLYTGRRRPAGMRALRVCENF